MKLPGAVARVEDSQVVILDLSKDHYKNHNLKHYGRSESDVVFAHMADPNFNKEFKKIWDIHDKNMRYFGIKDEYARGTSA